MSEPDFTVDFNREVAWTLAYDDALGRLVFVFEVGRHPKAVVLDTYPLSNNKVLEITEDNRARVNLAVERTKAFLKSCGYEVELHE